MAPAAVDVCECLCRIARFRVITVPPKEKSRKIFIDLCLFNQVSRAVLSTVETAHHGLYGLDRLPVVIESKIFIAAGFGRPAGPIMGPPGNFRKIPSSADGQRGQIALICKDQVPHLHMEVAEEHLVHSDPFFVLD